MLAGSCVHMCAQLPLPLAEVAAGAGAVLSQQAQRGSGHLLGPLAWLRPSHLPLALPCTIPTGAAMCA